jgi:glycosyltransferase involved in cell wall biosynthesis
LLQYARPRRVLEIGTALGHMTANFTRWTLDDAQICSLGIVHGSERAALGAPEQQVDVPTREGFARFADHFGKAWKVFFITADSMTYDFSRLSPLDLVFIDGGHDLEHVLNDSRKTYNALAPGGWVVWHDFNSPVPWVKVREAIEQIGFRESVVHIERTEVAFLRKQAELPSLRAIPRSSGPMLVAWEGDPQGLHSLAVVNRAICRGLLDRGHDLALIWDSKTNVDAPSEQLPLDAKVAERLGHRSVEGPPQVHVRHQWPPKLDKPPCGRWVWMQPWEFGSIPKAWLSALHEVDEVWAYSRYVRDCYLDAGMPAERVHVIPLGVDPEVFQPGTEPLPLPLGPKMRFVFVGGTIFRKGIDLLLAAFPRAFSPSDGFGLVIKDMGAKTFYRGQTAEAAIARLREQGYSVEYIDRDLGEQEMAGLYAACDCLVHPFRGEGFALPVIEAMASGLPVIVTGAGPVLDYATDETAYLIPARRGNFAELRVGELETIGRPWLWEPDRDALVENLRRVAADPAAARAKGTAASAWIRENFTWAHTVEAVERRLYALAAEEVPTPIGAFTAPGPQPAAQREVGQAFQPDGKQESYERPSVAEPTLTPGEAVQMPARTTVNGTAGFGRTEHVSLASAVDKSDDKQDVRLESLTYVGRAKVSLHMIVRDEQQNLPTCLESVRGLFDEIVVVDTGSRDNTIEIARSFGARVFDLVWVDDFAAARNAALARAKGDYAFWLDADDLVEPAERAKLEGLLSRLRSGGRPSAYVVRCQCDPGPDGSGGDTVVDHIRLFPVIEGVRWSYRVHEQILPGLKRAGVVTEWTDITVRHTGYSDRALRARKLERDSRILLQELAERPDEPFTLFNLGSIAVERCQWNEALGYLRKSLEHSAPTDSITRKLFALIARCYQMMGDFPAALKCCAKGLSFDPDDAELWFRKAIVHRQGNQPAEAEQCWRRILSLKRPQKLASVDQGIYGHLTRRNLAALATERGDREEAKAQWRAILEECPGDREALRHLG